MSIVVKNLRIMLKRIKRMNLDDLNLWSGHIP